MVQTAENIWRDFTTDGVPTSLKWDPRKVDIRAWGTWLETAIAAGQVSGAFGYDTKAHLDADTSKDANALGWVLADSTAANNGIYSFDGVDTWTRLADLPYSFIRATDAGAGTADAIVATTSIPLPANDAATLIALNIYRNNTGAVTVAFNGGSPLTIKTTTGADVQADYLVAGAIVAGYVSGSTFRLISDVGTSAAAAAAQAAADEAVAAAASANGAVPVADRTALKALDTSAKKAAVIYSESGRKGLFNWNSASLTSEMVTATVTTTAVDSGTETATKTAHGLRTGEAVIATTAVSGLATSTIYYVIWVDNNSFKLASTFANALAGTAINLTGTTNFTAKRLRDPLEGRYVAKTGAPLDGSGGAWVRDGDEINASHFGASASADGATNAAALFAAAQVSDVVRVDDDLTVTGDITGAVRDCLFVGDGSITGLYRKQVVSDRASGLVRPCTLKPAHVSRLQSSQTPVVVLVGDSLSTYNANSTGRGDTLAISVEKAIRSSLYPSQSLTFYDRGINGQTFSGFYSNTSTTTIDADAVWWVGGKTWKQQVIDLNPDVVIFSFGMNDEANIRIDQIATLVSDMASWASAPQIVFCTNMNPTLGRDATYAARSYQDGRDFAAGAVRTFALYNGYGLLDMNQSFVAARDGYDVRKSSLRSEELAATALLAQATCPTETIDFMCDVTIDLDEMAEDVGLDTINIKIGRGALDWLTINKTATNLVRWSLSAGQGANPYAYYKNVTTASLGSGSITLRIEVKDNVVTVYNPDTGGVRGTYALPIFTSKAIRCGGYFQPYVATTEGVNYVDSTIISDVSFWVADNKVVRPSVRDDDLFSAGTGLYFGSNFNHPGNLIGAHVYGPVLDAADFGPSEASSWFYTPTLAGPVNVTGTPTAYPARVTRIGENIIRVSGKLGVQPAAAANADTQLGISLPIASDLGNSNADLSGVATTGFGLIGTINADTENDRAILKFPAPNTAANTFNFTFDYIRKP